MRSACIWVVLAVALPATLAWSYYQDYYPPPASGYPTYYHSSTAAEGAMRGMSDVIRSQGDRNLSNSEAAINWSAARSSEIDNAQKYTDTYFEMRRVNREARAAERGPRPSSQDVFRYAQMGKPKRLSAADLNTVNGKVAWPRTLLLDEFSEQRGSLERIFAERAASGAVSLQDHMEVDRITKDMRADLQENIRRLPPSDYVAARKFLESLAYEATIPAS